MKRILNNLASDLGYSKVPDLEKIKASNLGHEVSPGNGIFMKILQNQGFLYQKTQKNERF